MSKSKLTSIRLAEDMLEAIEEARKVLQLETTAQTIRYLLTKALKKGSDSK